MRVRRAGSVHEACGRCDDPFRQSGPCNSVYGRCTGCNCRCAAGACRWKGLLLYGPFGDGRFVPEHPACTVQPLSGALSMVLRHRVPKAPAPAGWPPPGPGRSAFSFCAAGVSPKRESTCASSKSNWRASSRSAIQPPSSCPASWWASWGRTAVASRTSSMPPAGCWASRAPPSCVASRCRT